MKITIVIDGIEYEASAELVQDDVKSDVPEPPKAAVCGRCDDAGWQD